MAARFVVVDRETGFLLPPDMREWVPEGHLIHFVIEAVEQLDLRQAQVNERGCGAAQYPPSLMLGLLIYSYCTGVFSSRQIERSTYENVAVRMLCGNTHPDHDTICTFRANQKALLEQSFVRVIELASLCGVLKVGNITVAVDGTKVLAAASKHASVSYGKAGQKIKQLELEIGQLIQKAEQADSVPLQDGLSIPDEIKRRGKLAQKLAAARAELEAREALSAKHAAYERSVAAREAKVAAGLKNLGPKAKKPSPEPKASAQISLSEPESRIMKTGGNTFEQCYNGQAAVEVHSRLIVGAALINAECDKQQLVATVSTIVAPAGPVATVLADSGFFSEPLIRELEGTLPGQAPTGITVLSNIQRQTHGRTVEQLEKKPDPMAPPPQALFTEHMAHRVATQAGRARYKLRQETVEPVFGIIKGAMKFRRFSLRGLAKARLEWTLVTLAYNIKRLFHLNTSFAS